MKEKEILERIALLDYPTIREMSPEVIAKLTNYFEEKYVRALISRTGANHEQKNLILKIKDAYFVWREKNDLMWGVLQPKECPDFMEDLQVDIECGNIITKDAHIPPLRINLQSPVVDIVKQHMNNITIENHSSGSDNSQLNARIEELEQINREQEETIKQQAETIKSLTESNAQQKDEEQPDQAEQPEETSDSMQLKVRIELLNFLMRKAGYDLETITKNKLKSTMVKLYQIILGKGTTSLLTPCIGKVSYKQKPEGIDDNVKEINQLLHKINDDWRIQL